jgi:hypothetical protein
MLIFLDFVFSTIHGITAIYATVPHAQKIGSCSTRGYILLALGPLFLFFLYSIQRDRDIEAARTRITAMWKKMANPWIQRQNPWKKRQICDGKLLKRQ